MSSTIVLLLKLALIVVAIVLVPLPAWGQGTPPPPAPSPWTCEVTPYLWAAGLHGDLSARGREASLRD